MVLMFLKVLKGKLNREISCLIRTVSSGLSSRNTFPVAVIQGKVQLLAKR